MDQGNGTAQTQSDAIGIADILRILARRKLMIIGIMLVCLVASAVYTSRQPKKYEAECRIDIDLNTPKSSLDLQSSNSGSSSTDQKMATQLGIITSQSIAWDVINKLKLTSNPDFVGRVAAQSPAPLSSLSDIDRYSLIRSFQGGLTVQFERGTEIAQIRYKSISPILAAQIANAVAESYIQHNFETKYTTTRTTSTWLNGQLQTLRTQVSDAEQEFADFQKKTGLLQTDESHSALQDRINQLNTALSTAQTARILKEIAFRESASADPDQVLPSAALPTLVALRNQHATLESEYASLTTKYGDAYPRVVQLKNELTQVQAGIDSQIKRGRQQLELEYRAAMANEDQLRAAVEAQKEEIFSMNENALRYSILQRQVVSVRDLYEDLTRKLQEAQITSGLSSDTISVIDRALAPSVPTEPRRSLNLEVGLLLGVVLGIATAFLLDNLNTTVRSLEDVARYSGLPVLGLIPHAPLKQRNGRDATPDEAKGPVGPRVLQDTRSHFAESFRILRSSILLSSAGGPPQFILVCSAWPFEGKSTVSLNLSMTLAQAGKKVLLVDGDLIRPSLHSKLGVGAGDVGLSSLLTTAEYVSPASYVHPGVTVPTLDFLPAGKIPPASAELLMSQKMSELLKEWRTMYDFVVVDSAPVLAVSDSSSLASIADATIMVVRAGVTRRQSLRALRDTITSVRGKIAGVLLNDVETNSDLYYDYYGGKGKYGVYYSENSNE